MKKIFTTFLLIISLFMITGCNYKNEISKENNHNEVKESEQDTMDNITNIEVVIENQKYNVVLKTNETAQAFVNLLPKDFQMSELNGNEKYVYMNESLPTNAYKPKEIKAGDIMLYGSDCLVIFYKSFSTNYSYTKIGHIENLPDLGSDDVLVKFLK